MDANTEIAVAAGVLTAGILAFGYSLKKMTRLSHKRMGVMERRLEDLAVYTRHLADDVTSLHEGLRRKIDGQEARLRMDDAAEELSMIERQTARATT